MNIACRFDRYRELQSYVSWTDDDARRIGLVAPRLDPDLPAHIDDFHAQIERHPAVLKMITGGQPQIDRLKRTSRQWVRELLTGRYDKSYVDRRWRVGWRHVEIGLDQVDTNVASSRIRTSLGHTLQVNSDEELSLLNQTSRSLNNLLDLDLAIIEDADQAEYAVRLHRSDRLMTLGQVAGGVAHKGRNPLNVVKTSVDYRLKARNQTPEKNGEHPKRIERQGCLAVVARPCSIWSARRTRRPGPT